MGPTGYPPPPPPGSYPQPPQPQKPLMIWEELESAGGGHLAVRRAKVPGGWLVYASNGYHHHGGMSFYPDPEHRWNGGTLP